MGIEDAAVLSRLLSQASPEDDLRQLVKIYESLRRPRCEKVREWARVLGVAWSASESKTIQSRDRFYAMQRETDSALDLANVEADANAPFGAPAFDKWLDLYDVFEAVDKELLSYRKTAAKL